MKIDKRKSRASQSNLSSDDGEEDDIPLSAFLSIGKRDKSSVTPGNSAVTGRSLDCGDDCDLPLSALLRINMRQGLNAGRSRFEVSRKLEDFGVGISEEKSRERSFKDLGPATRCTGEHDSRLRFSDVSVSGERDEVMLNKEDFSAIEVEVMLNKEDFSAIEVNGSINGSYESDCECDDDAKLSCPLGLRGKHCWGLEEKNEPIVDENASGSQEKKNGIGVIEDSCPMNGFSMDEESSSYEEDNGFAVMKEAIDSRPSGFQKFKIGDLVWAKAVPYKWWPGWIYRRAGFQVAVSFFGCKRSRLFEESEVCGFEDKYLALSKMAGGKLLDAIGCALKDLCRRVALELSCPCLSWSEDVERGILSNVEDQTSNFVEAKEGFEPVELLSIVHKMAVCAQFHSDEAVRAAKVIGQVNAFRRYVSIRLDWMYYKTMGLSGSSSVIDDSEGEDSGAKDLVEQNSTSVLQLGTEGMRVCHLRAAHHDADIGTEFNLNSGSTLLDDVSYVYEETLNLCRTDSVHHSSADADNGNLSTTVLEPERELNQDDAFIAASESKVENSSTKHVFSSCGKQNDVAAAVWAHKSETSVRPENEFQLSSPLSREPLVISKAHIYAGYADKGQSLHEMLKYIYCLSLDPFYTGAGHLDVVRDNVLRFRRLVYKSVPNPVSLKCILDYDDNPKLHDLFAMDPCSCPSPTKYAIKTQPIYEVGVVNEMTGKNQLLLHSSDDKIGMDECNKVSAVANTNDNVKVIINHLTCPVKSFEDGSIGKRLLDFPGVSNLPFKLRKTQPPPSVHGSRIDSSVTETKQLRPRNPADSDLAYEGTMKSHQDMLRHLHCLALDLFYFEKENLKSVKKMILRYRALVSLNITSLVSSTCTSLGGHALRILEASELSGSGLSPRHQDCTSVAMSCPDFETGFVNGGNNGAQLFSDIGDDSTKIHPRKKVGTAMHDVDQDINRKEVNYSVKYRLDRSSGTVLGKRRVDEPVASDPLKLLKSGSSSLASASASDSIMVIPRSNTDAQNLSDLAFVEHISSGVHELETATTQQKMSIFQPLTHFTDSVANIHLDGKVRLEDDAITEIQLASHARDKGAKKPCAESNYLAEVNGTSEKRGIICSSDDMQKCLDVGVSAISAPPYVKVDVKPKATEISQLSCEIGDNSQKISSEVSCSGPHRENVSQVVHRKRRHAPLVDSRLSFNSQLGHLYASPLLKDVLNARVDDQKISKMGKFPGRHVCLHMKFPKDFSLPTKDELVKKFSVFGPLDVSSSRVFFYTGSAQVIFLHQHNAEAACLHARRKNLFGKANVRFWLSNRTGAQPPPLPVAVEPACKSCLKTSNADQRQLAGLKFLTENPDNPLPLMTLEKKRSVTFSGLSGFYDCSGEEKPDISLQMLLLLDRCDQMVCEIRETLGLGSYYSIFMYMSGLQD